MSWRAAMPTQWPYTSLPPVCLRLRAVTWLSYPAAATSCAALLALFAVQMERRCSPQRAFHGTGAELSTTAGAGTNTGVWRGNPPSGRRTAFSGACLVVDA